NYTDWSSASFTTEINTIGADWKEFNMGTMSYEIAEDRVYFVKTGAGDIWKVIPTGFGGSADGNFEFTKEKISALSTDKYGMPNAEVIIYPNPANEKISLLLNNMNSSSTTVQIMNLEGQIVFEQAYVEESNFEVKNIPVHSFRKGVYIIKVQSGNQHFNQKLIIK
ncbi:MAG TPA: T9SS type A sorting domain-containing protein, partial [Brumimicrobium sp.]|nr:T9SS type A sorting domain-containing protein [Brumimicrobium sp.]